jgi:putative transposase
MREQIRRRHLPHLDVPGATYFVTSCLAGSIPAQGLLEIARLEQNLLASRPPHIPLKDWKTIVWKKTFVAREAWLDGRPVARHLAEPTLAAIVAGALRFFSGERYDLLAWVVMPSHFHWVFRPRDEWISTLADFDKRTPRERIMHGIKRDSALKCNRVLGLSGPFWQDESYDHVVRDEDELARIVEYIELNPVKAGLCASRETWQWSSAYIGQVSNLS